MKIFYDEFDRMMERIYNQLKYELSINNGFLYVGLDITHYPVQEKCIVDLKRDFPFLGLNKNN